MKIWLNCEQAGRLTSDALDRPLTRSERIGVALHRAMCKRCAALARDLQLIRSRLRILATGRTAETWPVPPLDDARLRQIAEAVAEAAKRSPSEVHTS